MYNMENLSENEVERILIELEDKGYLDLKYKFVRNETGLKLLGNGGYSYVYEMYGVEKSDKNDSQNFALKVMGLGTQSLDVDYIIEKNRIQSVLSEQCKNILKVYKLWIKKVELDDKGSVISVVDYNDRDYAKSKGIELQLILMERLESIVVKDRYRNVGVTREELKSTEGVLKLAKNIGRALVRTHNNEYLHRDIKLENIFYDEKIDEYKIGDFGFAKYVGEDNASTVIFTDGYGAPEIVKKLTTEYGITADIYSFGITLYLLLNNMKFPASEGYYANIVQYSNNFIVPAPPDVNEDIARLVRKMCSFRREDRYQSVEELLSDIKKCEDKAAMSEEAYDDALTVTFRENETGKRSSEALAEIDWENDNISVREQIKNREIECETKYKERQKSIIVDLSVLFLLLFAGIITKEAIYNNWVMILVPLILLTASLTQQTNSVKTEISIFLIIITAIIAYRYDMWRACSVIIPIILLDIPGVTLSSGIGAAGLIGLYLFDKMNFLKYIADYDLGWIAGILIMFIIEMYIYSGYLYYKISRERLINLTGYGIIIAEAAGILGVIFMLSDITGICPIPQFIKHMHLIRLGACAYIIKLYFIGFIKEEVYESLD